MRKTFILLAILLFPGALLAQSENYCDSLTIECCSYNSFAPNTLSIQVSNASSYIFPYPGFILLDQDDDTVAVETVNYYGIGTYFQEHGLSITGSLELPFEGTLELHTGFYAVFACSFPFSIGDTVSTGIAGQKKTLLKLSPNPAGSSFRVEIPGSVAGKACSMVIRNAAGIKVYETPISAAVAEVSPSEVGPAGVYFVSIIGPGREPLAVEKLILH